MLGAMNRQRFPTLMIAEIDHHRACLDWHIDQQWRIAGNTQIAQATLHLVDSSDDAQTGLVGSQSQNATAHTSGRTVDDNGNWLVGGQSGKTIGLVDGHERG